MIPSHPSLIARIQRFSNCSGHRVGGKVDQFRIHPLFSLYPLGLIAFTIDHWSRKTKSDRNGKALHVTENRKVVIAK